MELKDDFEFQFDEPQQNKPFSGDEDIIELDKPAAQLTCSCPKCAAEILLDLPETDQQVTDTTCPACNAAVSIIRESCANRAQRRSREISCVKCGTPLDHSTHCSSCGLQFPDYFVASTPQDVRNKARKKQLASFKQSIKKFNPSFYFDFARKTTEQQRRPQRPDIKLAQAQLPSQTFINPRVLRLLVALLILSALIGGGSYAYNLHQHQQKFADTYFKAIYGINTGNDYSLKACARMVAEWKSSGTGSYIPRLNEKEESKVNKIQFEVDKLIQQIGTPPAKFALAHQKLLQLRGAYQKSQDLANSPPRSLQALTASAEQAGSNFNTVAQELKSSLPEPLKDDFEKAKLKYRGLKEL